LEELSLKNDQLTDFGQTAQAVSALKNLQRLCLMENRFVSIDLSLLNGMNTLAKLNLKSNGQLKTVAVMNLDRVPSSLKQIDLSTTTVETIDPKMNDILNRTGFDKLDLSANKKINCETNINWMAKQAFCQPMHLIITDAQCNNGTSLEAYLRASVPNPCGTETTSTSTAAGTTSSGTTTGSTTVGTPSTGSTTGGGSTGTSGPASSSGSAGSDSTTAASTSPGNSTSPIPVSPKTSGASTIVANIFLVISTMALLFKF